MNKEKFLIISFDAVDGEDLDFLCMLPNFKEILKSSSYSRNVKTIYPSLTYPAHTSIITGLYPINHKITNNIKLQPNRCNSSDWFWSQKEIKRTTLFDIINQKNLVCSSILWPVSCNAKIKYNMPEVFANRPWQNQIIASALGGSIFYQLDLNKKYAHLRDGLKQPNLDNFAMACFLDTLKEHNPDVMFLHLTDVDTNKHKNGCKSINVKNALLRHDERLGEIIKILKEKNILDKTHLILLGDHSMKDAHSVIKINKLFNDNGFLKLDTTKSKILNYDAYCNFCDGAAYIYIKDKNKISEISNLLNDFSKRNDDCIKEILSKEKAISKGAASNCDLMLEARDGYYFINDFNGHCIESTKYYDKATHGYNPDTYENGTFIIVSSPKVKNNFNIGDINLIDIAPTIAKLLDSTLKNADGKILDIFK